MKYFTIVLFAAVLCTACQSGKDHLREKIGEMEGRVFDDSTQQVDRKAAMELIVLYEQYANTYPDDTLSAQYLFKAGDYANGTGDYMSAIRYYKMCSEYEDYSRKEIAFFLQGFIYENQLHDLDKARAIYSEFLERYPNHHLARDVEFSLQNLGKTPEDLIRMFEERDSIESAQADTTQAATTAGT
jgi:tetratricopeptide (TPR) repeat protein